MSEQQAWVLFDDEQKLQILHTITLPELIRHNFDPLAILPHLGQIIDDEQQDQIQDKVDAGKRSEAVEMLISLVIEKKKFGLNIFLDALEGNEDTPRWDRFLTPFEGGDDQRQTINDCFAFIVRLLKGQIIEKLTEGELEKIINILFSERVIGGIDMENINAAQRQKGRPYAALKMFQLMRQHRADWPTKFLLALAKVKPILVHKMGLLDDSQAKEAASVESMMEKEPEKVSSEQSEETSPKEVICRQEVFRHPAGNLPNEEILEQIGSVDEELDFCAYFGSNLAASDLEEDREGFSDDNEKADSEKSEKQLGALKKEHQGPQDLRLREYQKELAEDALKGLNAIICAPTGSGKTRVATHIIQQHFEAEAHIDASSTNQAPRKRKAVFMAHTGALATQQSNNFKCFLPSLKTKLVTGQSKDCVRLHQLLHVFDIFVVTPKILENHLTPDKIPSLEVFSMLIFDECHHTKKGAPYMSIMKSYLKSKKQGQKVPQIVGLTASISVEGATVLDEAVKSVQRIMANLDCHPDITEVQKNYNELKKMVPEPTEIKPLPLTPRQTDEVSRSIKNTMHKIEELLEECAEKMSHAKVDGIMRKLRDRPQNHKEQCYGQWAVGLYDQARTMKVNYDGDMPELNEQRRAFQRAVQLIAKWLLAYHVALEVHDLVCPEDVLRYLQKSFQNPETYESSLQENLFGFFEELEAKLDKLSEPNPNLTILAETIFKHLSHREDDDFRILVFVRTRATCKALCRWLNSSDVHPKLKQLRALAFTGIGAHQSQGGMTQSGQEAVLAKFRSGEVKLLVSTSIGEEGIDIPECDFTIKYNHIGNEVTTVQTRGRNRKPGGKSVLLAMQDIIDREQVNKHREELMQQAIKRIHDMPEETAKVIAKFQDEILAEASTQEVRCANSAHVPQQSPFFLESECHHIRVSGSQIRTINGNQRVIVGHDIDDLVEQKKHSENYKKPNTDDVDMWGSYCCKKCGVHLGQVAEYKKNSFFVIGLGGKSKAWILLAGNGEPLTPQYKQWKKVPYPQALLSPEDILQHAGHQGNGSEAVKTDSELGAVGGSDA